MNDSIYLCLTLLIELSACCEFQIAPATVVAVRLLWDEPAPASRLLNIRLDKLWHSMGARPAGRPEMRFGFVKNRNSIDISSFPLADQLTMLTHQTAQMLLVSTATRGKASPWSLLVKITWQGVDLRASYKVQTARHANWAWHADTAPLQTHDAGAPLVDGAQPLLRAQCQPRH